MPPMTTTERATATQTTDFLPLNGIDHVEFWVGNAKQAAHYFRTLWGFTPVAYAGLETGVRDRASYVMVQNDIRFVLTAPITPDGELAEHVARHGDGVHDIAFAVDDVAVGLARDDHSVARGPRRSRPSRRARRAVLRTARHPHLRRGDPHASSTGATTRGTFAPGYHRIDRPAPAPHRADPARGRPLRRERGAGRHESVRGLLPRRAGLQPADPLRRQGDPHRVQRPDEQGHAERATGASSSRSTSPPRARRRARSRSSSITTSRPGTQHIALRTDRHRGHGAACCASAGVEFLGLPHEYYADAARPGRRTSGYRWTRSRSWASRPTATRRVTCSRSSPSRSRTGPRSSSRSSSATDRRGFGVGQLQGPVRGDRARAGEAREPLEREGRLGNDGEEFALPRDPLQLVSAPGFEGDA